MTSPVAPDLLVRVAQHGPVTELVLGNDRKRNALTAAMISTLTRVVENPPAGTRALVITGAPHFCAGADIAVYADGRAEEIAAFTSGAGALLQALTDSPLPVLAAVEGVALGGGFELALAADLVIAAQTASFGLPETQLGLIPGWGGTQRLTAQVGIRRAKQLIMLAERIDARSAFDLGLVNAVCPAGQAQAQALDWAHRLSAGSASALAAAKAMTNLGQGQLSLEAERQALMELFTSPDGIEGVLAFREKRPPQFGPAP
ncbi:enoyl-CoA hydratase/isomerase family protein [uncultured Friedmanniella sp.]|uniref:enoyl-CoA hydratase/isomerase family protein n=1 Tax=uncultured Friedmanniella sp. TaxID=335381 RepID=UPI0035C99B88